MRPRKSIIVDVDGTLANIEHRLHHIGGRGDVTDEEQPKTDWDAFHEACDQDAPITAVCDMVRELADADWCIILMTGRGGENREKTEAWLAKNDVPYDILLMRKAGDHSPDVNIKAAWLEKIRDGQISVPGMLQPEIVIEDRARVVDMWRRQGLVALQCDEGDF